ncbi:MAG: hypothetical protein A2078_08185 [Nitrospirae bacterium GWC2_57_9]|nr:MAG: hypothetical protein A2078_08185 [Nitrospirae bacterium GWC2_57_9]
MMGWAVTTRKWLDGISLTWLTRVIRLFSLFVPYRIGLWSGAALGFAAYYLLPRERTRTIDNISLVFPDKRPEELRHIAHGCFVHLGKSLFEVMLMNPVRLKRLVDLRGEENLRSALAQGRGVIFVTGHVGNWELLGHTVAALSSLSVVAAPIKPEPVNDMIVDLRARMGVRTILRGRPGASRELIRVFKENRILGILIDQDTDVESVFVEFMGKPAWTPSAAVSMSIKFSAPIVFGYIHREKNGRHTIRIEGPLELLRTGNDEQNLVMNTQMLTKKIENGIMQDPVQWVWMHRRWRRQP